MTQRMRLLLLLFVGIQFVTLARAENYPYRSDVLWVTVPDKADWLYQTGEKAKVEIQFYKYGIPRDVEVSYELGYDMLPAHDKGKLVLKNGRGVIALGTMKDVYKRQG